VKAIRLASTLLLALACSAVPAAAEIVVNDHQELDFDRPQSWAMARTAAVLYPSELAAPQPLAPGAVELSLEGGWVPSLDAEQRTVGLLGNRPEDLNRTSVIGRPRVAVGLPSAFTLTLGWAPPVELQGVKPNFLSASLARPLWQGERSAFAARLVGLSGNLSGDLTCPANVAGNPDFDVNPYSCEAPSNDEMTLRLYGAEVSASATPVRWPRFSPYVTLGASHLHAEFQVDAHRGGFYDRALLETDGTIWNASAGFSFAATDRMRLVGEVFWAPLTVEGRAGNGRERDDLLNVRALFAYRLR
jgi:hypothetical protein